MMMKTEKDIRKFMQDNKMCIPDNDVFMKDLVRQINLLPVPAAMSAEEERVQENMRLLNAIRVALRKRYRKQALGVLLADLMICLAIFCAGSFLLSTVDVSSSAMQIVFAWRYMILGLLSLATLAISLLRFRFYSI